MQNRRRLIFPRAASAKKPEPEVSFDFECPRTWESLTPTQDPKVRHCNDCEKPVHLSRNAAEAQAHAKLGRCISVPAAVVRPVSAPSWLRRFITSAVTKAGAVLFPPRLYRPVSRPVLDLQKRPIPESPFTSYSRSRMPMITGRPKRSLVKPPSVGCYLVPLDGVQSSKIFLRRFSTLGGSFSDDLTINLPGIRPSHCSITISDEKEVILWAPGEPRNTFVDGQLVEVCHKLVDGQLISLAGFRLVFNVFEMAKVEYEEEFREDF